MHHRMPACFSKTRFGSKTARSTITGAWSKTAGSMADAGWCGAMRFIWAKSIPPNRPPGARRSRSLRTARSGPERFHCFRRSELRKSMTTRSSAFAWINWSCAGRGSGALAGWPVFPTKSSDWMGFGAGLFRPAAKARAGNTCSKRWSAIGSSIRAANGVCTGNGSTRARWPICSGPIAAWPPPTRSIVVWTSWPNTRRRSFRICRSGGRISLPRASTCCSTT